MEKERGGRRDNRWLVSSSHSTRAFENFRVTTRPRFNSAEISMSNLSLKMHPLYGNLATSQNYELNNEIPITSKCKLSISMMRLKRNVQKNAREKEKNRDNYYKLILNQAFSHAITQKIYKYMFIRLYTYFLLQVVELKK